MIAGLQISYKQSRLVFTTKLMNMLSIASYIGVAIGRDNYYTAQLCSCPPSLKTICVKLPCSSTHTGEI